MDLNQLCTDVNRLARMAESSRDRLSKLADRASSLRQRLEALLRQAEPPAGK